MKNWYAVQTYLNQEDKTRLALISRGYEVYLPLTLIDKRKIQGNTNEEEITEPLFETYLFLNMDEGIDDFYPITEIKTLNKVIRMSKRDDGYSYPTKIPYEVIMRLRQLEDAQGIHSTHKSDYEEGDEVLITSGAFIDFPAKIHSMNKNQRVTVLIELFNTLKEVDVDYREMVPCD